jgi:hypothetical protein
MAVDSRISSFRPRCSPLQCNALRLIFGKLRPQNQPCVLYRSKYSWKLLALNLRRRDQAGFRVGGMEGG